MSGAIASAGGWLSAGDDVEDLDVGRSEFGAADAVQHRVHRGVDVGLPVGELHEPAREKVRVKRADLET